MARRCLNTEAQRHRARSCTVPDASRIAGAGKVRLGDVCSFSKGQQINGKELSDSYDYPFINGGVSPSGNWKDYNVEKGAITISEGGNSCGFVNYFEVPFWCGAHCYYFYELKLEPKYFYYALKANEERLMGLRSGICMPNIRKGDLDEFEFCIDWDKATQQRITAELDRLCALKKNAEDRLAILDQIVKSRFVEMFGGGCLSDEKQLFSEICEFVTVGIANSATHVYAESGVPMLRNQNIREGSLDDSDLVHIKSEFAEKYRSKTLKENDLLIVRTGYPGVSCVVPKKYEGAQTFTTLIARLRDLDETDPVFVCHYLNSPYGKEYVDKSKVGIAQQNFGARALEGMPIFIPHISLQREFAAFVGEIDKSKLTLRETVATLDQLYRATLQEYFG